MLDGILLEKTGVPSASIVTDVFEMTGEQWSAGIELKFPGARRLTMRAWEALKASKGAVVFPFLSSDDEDATAPVAALAKQLGFAPVALGKLNEGGDLVHARGRTWGQLIFQDLFKKEQ